MVTIADPRILYIETDDGWTYVPIHRCKCGAAYRFLIRDGRVKLFCQGCWYTVYEYAIH